MPHVSFTVQNIIVYIIQHFLYRSGAVILGFIFFSGKLYRLAQDLYKKMLNPDSYKNLYRK